MNSLISAMRLALWRRRAWKQMWGWPETLHYINEQFRAERNTR